MQPQDQTALARSAAIDVVGANIGVPLEMDQPLPEPIALPPPVGRVRMEAGVYPPTMGRTREEAEVLRIEADIKLRTRVALIVLLIFAALNVGVMWFLVHALSVDIELLHTLPTAERLIDNKVVMSVVAATAAQVGVAIVTIVSHLFPRVSAVGDK